MLFGFDQSTWLLIFIRLGSLLAVMPFVPTQQLPPQIRVAMAAMLAFLLAPGLPPMDAASLPWLGLVRLVFTEVSIGLLLGFVCRLIFHGLEIAGGLLATETGLNAATIFNPLQSTPTPVTTMILHWLGMMLWLTLDLHHWMITALRRSYDLIPMGGGHLNEGLWLEMVARTGALFGIGLQIAAPVVATGFLVTLIFSLLGRAVPQMNSFTESFSVRLMVGLTVFGLSVRFMSEHIINYLRRLPEDFLKIAGLLGGA